MIAVDPTVCHWCSQAEHAVGCPQDVADGLARTLGRLLPPGWHEVRRVADGAAFVNYVRGLSVIVSVEAHGRNDSDLWCHVSVSAGRKVPRWSDLVEVKEWLLGVDRYAYQVIPSRRDYVNSNPGVLHLFAPWDPEYRPLPDFTRGSRSL